MLMEGCSCRQFFAGIDCVLGEATLADAGRLIKLYRGVVPPLSRRFFLLRRHRENLRGFGGIDGPKGYAIEALAL